jgi:NitT/TauT family transport system permease protein
MRVSLKTDDPFVRTVAPFVVGVIMLTVWEVVCRAANVPKYLFPTPSEIAVSLFTQAPMLLRALESTLLVTLEAFAIAVVVGTFISFVFVQSKLLEVSLFPYAVLAQVTPIVAVAPLSSCS